MFYYSGLPSSPKLVYRTGRTPWAMPIGPEAYRPLKELRPVFGHKLNTVWKDLGPEVRKLLDSQGVLWTSIDVVRFIKVGASEGPGPVVLWIGIAPETLSTREAYSSANSCLDLLNSFEITDVEVEYRESIYTRLANPNFLEPVSSIDPTADIRGPLTPVLGLSIAAQTTPYVEGTGGLYLAEGGESMNNLLITARHVLFPPDQGINVEYPHANTSTRRKVLILGTKAFENLVKSIKIRIGSHAAMVEHYEGRIGKLRARQADETTDVKKIEKELKKTVQLLDEANEAIEDLEKFHKEVEEGWSKPAQRVLGHITRSPPITYSAGTAGFTEDYAVIELDNSKFKNAFVGNAIDLGTFFIHLTKTIYQTIISRDKNFTRQVQIHDELQH